MTIQTKPAQTEPRAGQKRPVKAVKGMNMEGPVARWYAKNTRKIMADFQADAAKIAAELAPGADVLEVAPGPGYLAIELAKLGDYHITGLDISATFVEIARKNAQAAGAAIDFQQGNAAQMPFAGGSFDFIVCRAAFKNFAEPVLALNEIHRVLRVGGKAAILDLRGDVTPEAINRHVQSMGLNWINTLLTQWAFRFMLVKRAYTAEQFRALVAQSAFQQCTIDRDDLGMTVHLHKA